MEPTPELRAVPPGTDLFSAADRRAAADDAFEPLQGLGVRARTPTKPPVAALFFAFGLPFILAPFAPHIRYVFFLVLIGGAVAVYEWAMDGL